MKKQMILSALFVSSIFQTTNVAYASNADVGAIIGGVIGGVAGSKIGKGHGNTAATIIGAIAGSMIGSRLGAQMDNSDRRALEDAQRQSLNGGMNRNCDWDGRQYGSRTGARGRFTATREGYNSRSGEYCREYESTIYLRDRNETNRGIACQDRNGSWYESNSSEVNWGGRGDRGDHGPGYGRGPGRPMPPSYPTPPSQRYEESSIQISSITRKTGGEWVRVSLDYPVSISQIEVRTLSAGMKIHDAMVYTESGRQFPIRQYQETGTLYAGDRLASENLSLRDRVTTIDLRMESMGGYADVLVKVMSMDGRPSLRSSRY
ncbi:MAG: beta-sandwich domain-containing protein [Bacillota bacterium]